MQRPLIPDVAEQQTAQMADTSVGRRFVDNLHATPFLEPAPDRRSDDRRSGDRRAGEQRAAQRRRVLLSGLIVKTDFGGVFRCGVHDVSDGGARLKIPEGILLPAQFWLIANSAGKAYEAETIWRRYPSVGVSVSEPIDLQDPTTRNGRRLRTLWMTVAG
jgi:hypothetical protein